MKDGDTRIIQWEETLPNGTKITVPNLVVHMYQIDHGDGEGFQWEQVMPGESCRRIERAIEQACPGYFNRRPDIKSFLKA